jgi:hypothetical protein
MEFEDAKKRRSVYIVFHLADFVSETFKCIFEERVIVESDETNRLITCVLSLSISRSKLR